VYVGLEAHKKSSYYSVIDGQGTEMKKGRFTTTGEDLDEFAGNLPCRKGSKWRSRRQYRVFLCMSIWMKEG